MKRLFICLTIVALLVVPQLAHEILKKGTIHAA